MRIGILSDIHVDINQEAGKPVMEGLKAAIIIKALDKMIIAGDIAIIEAVAAQNFRKLRRDTPWLRMVSPSVLSNWDLPD